MLKNKFAGLTLNFNKDSLYVLKYILGDKEVASF